MPVPRLFRALCLSVLLIGPAGAWADHYLVREGKPEAVLLLGANPSSQDEFIAREVAAYIERMTGADMPIERLPGSGDASRFPVLIGRPDTHKAIAALVDDGRVTIDEQDLTSEGFVLKTTTWKNQPCLVIAGGGDVGTVYAGYDLLERFGRIGFFRYEEHVPRRRDFAVPDCDIRERPHFRVRMHGGQYHYFGIHWFSEAQWEQNLRWYAKCRLNRTNYLPGPPVQSLTEHGAWRRMGIEQAPAAEPRARQPAEPLAMLGRLTRLGIKLGVKAPFASTDGSIPPAVLAEFRRTHPDARLFGVKRGNTTHTFLDPSDPLWLKLNQALLDNAIEYFGDTKLYSLPSPWTEMSPGDTPEEKERLTRDFAAAVGRLTAWAEEAHPGAEWMLDGWAFANKEFWQPYRVKRMLDSLPEELDLVLWDYPAEDEPTYVYNSYWFGRAWAYIVMHSSAGNSTVHGDVRGLMGSLFRVLCDQRAYKLSGFGNYTEANDYAPFFKDLLTHLAWDPMIEVDAFVRDYCERRYSAESVEAMTACHAGMLKTVYGPQSDTHMTSGFRTVRLQDPVYGYLLGAHWVPFDELQRRMVLMRRHWPGLLRDALADAVSVGERERGNAAYVRDLADLMRSYVHVRMNAAVWGAAQAAHRGDKESFEKHYAQIENLFDHLLQAIGLVAHRWEFGVNALVRDFEDAPLKYSPEEIRHYLYYVTWSGDRIYDYNRTDRYELIRDIYRPVTMAYMDACRKQLQGGEAPSGQRGKDVWEQRWEYGTLMDATAVPARAYESTGPTQPIIDEFLQGPCPPPPDPGDPVAVARRFLSAAQAGDI